jgi:uncharacterized protein (TIGR00375 family)
MSFIADLHIHSSYSRATSGHMIPETIWQWAQLKGITVTGTGDFTHPGWFKELAEKLAPVGNGLLQLKREHNSSETVPRSCAADVFFLLSAEISCIYRKYGKTRRIHCMVFVPDFAQAARITSELSRIGNIASDGRPILRLDAKDLLRITLDVSPDAMFVPAHVWTPHFSVFGAQSGFDSLEECFEDLTPHVFALETGLSSDPPMNWRVSALDSLTLISNSDAHSPSKMGREANVFDTVISYRNMTGAIKTRKGFLGTLEFFPEEGKYHHDGHRACGVCCDAEETQRHGCLCPVCGKRLTLGVAHRVEALADRPSGLVPPGAPAYRSLIPLIEVIAEARGTSPASKGAGQEYLRLLTALGSEFTILLQTPQSDIESASSPMLAEAVRRVREGMVEIRPGYDGAYGRIKIFGERERREIRGP